MLFKEQHLRNGSGLAQWPALVSDCRTGNRNSRFHLNSELLSLKTYNKNANQWKLSMCFCIPSKIKFNQTVMSLFSLGELDLVDCRLDLWLFVMLGPFRISTCVIIARHKRLTRSSIIIIFRSGKCKYYSFQMCLNPIIVASRWMMDQIG